MALTCMLIYVGCTIHPEGSNLLLHHHNGINDNSFIHNTPAHLKSFIQTAFCPVKVLHSKVMARETSEQANMLMSIGLPQTDPACFLHHGGIRS